jgi:hypothetical protein
LLRGENAERRILGGRFGSVVSNFYAIIGRTVKLLTFTTTYFTSPGRDTRNTSTRAMGKQSRICCGPALVSAGRPRHFIPTLHLDGNAKCQ